MNTQATMFARAFKAYEDTVGDTHPLRVVGITFEAGLIVVDEFEVF